MHVLRTIQVDNSDHSMYIVVVGLLHLKTELGEGLRTKVPLYWHASTSTMAAVLTAEDSLQEDCLHFNGWQKFA